MQPYEIRRRPGGRWEVSTAGGYAMLIFDSTADLKKFADEIMQRGSDAATNIVDAIKAAERKPPQRAYAATLPGQAESQESVG